MFEGIKNNITLFFWGKRKRSMCRGKVIVTRSCEVYNDTVYDLRWQIKRIDHNGKKVASRTLQERANKWNLKNIIRSVEDSALSKVAEEMLAEHSKG